MSLVHVSLFSGIGGFETAMAAARVPTLAACEIDTHAAGVIRQHYPDTHIYTDVKEVTGDSLRSLGADPARTVLTAGWPCQGNSVAGRRGGMDDARSGLWSEVARILAEHRPAWFIGENVPGLLSVNDGTDYATVIGDMARLGYGFAWRILDARHFGVPQRRRRIVLVGRLGDTGRAPAQVLLEPESSGWNPAQSIAPRPIFARRTGSSAEHARVAGTLTAREAKGPDSDATTTLVVSATGEQAHTLTGQGFDASEDGTGRGTPIIAYQKVRRSGERDADGTLPPEVWAERETAATLSPNDLTSEHRAIELIVAPGVAATLSAGQSASGVSAPGRRQEDDYNLVVYAADQTTALDTAQGGPDDNAAQGGHLIAPDAMTVRRLTPLEDERLQGYPDHWTALSDGKPQSDSQRYKQLGNSIAIPVFEWVARRLVAVDQHLTQESAA